MRFLLLFIAFHFFQISTAQLLSDHDKNYTRADSLRGSLRPERTGYDVLKYDLYVKVIPEEKYISGVNKITFKTLEELPKMQLDLFKNMKVDSITYKGKKVKFYREFNAVFIEFEQPIQQKKESTLNFYYSGKPIVAKTPPWDGGFIFTKDKNNEDWVSVAVQGTGASLWYPNKDHLSDEPEEAEIHIAAPKNLVAVSNGRLLGKEKVDENYTQWNWKVTNPINNYNIILNIGDYVNFSDHYKDLDLNYYVLSYNLEKAKKSFKEVTPMMDCFYEKIGPYPFPEDSYKLVETPFLGMEHQSAVAYGNGFNFGYMGRDLSGTGVGLNWDYIIIHESGHEWFGNSITAKDIADMWIHESFTSYTEAIYIECRWGLEKALTYLNGLRQTMVSNDRPIIGDYGVNSEGSGDMYFKGANMINTLRFMINDDEKWWEILNHFTSAFKHTTTDTEAVVRFFEEETDLELASFFNQYLRHTKLPELQFKKENATIYYRWKTDVENFKMPVELLTNQKEIRITPSNSWQKLDKSISKENLQVNLKKFYITTNLNEVLNRRDHRN
ncbi:M1 family metallopeptidase [Mesonia aestuariivivens]|uniref:M1 family metallopeptidase n=1 Tax=Mesonia aestuariivivens TaxID=2796128 RepID=A0ABS6W2G6_9FLAO|nr:M1 family metallopeptidase [Mesonia aestuariivivens]MBW2962045.1 M1 family metallopeptidase [Mesonia aestuariivivens]